MDKWLFFFKEILKEFIIVVKILLKKTGIYPFNPYTLYYYISSIFYDIWNVINFHSLSGIVPYSIIFSGRTIMFKGAIYFDRGCRQCIQCGGNRNIILLSLSIIWISTWEKWLSNRSKTVADGFNEIIETDQEFSGSHPTWIISDRYRFVRSILKKYGFKSNARKNKHWQNWNSSCTYNHLDGLTFTRSQSIHLLSICLNSDFLWLLYRGQFRSSSIFCEFVKEVNYIYS